VAEQRSDSHVGNLVHVPIHVRVGADDQTTHPFYSRRMLRLLADARQGNLTDVTFEELAGKEHWWWDTNAANDGGAGKEATMRKFFGFVQSRPSIVSALSQEGARTVPQFSLPSTMMLSSANPFVSGGLLGVRILAHAIPQAIATATISRFHAQLTGSAAWSI